MSLPPESALTPGTLRHMSQRAVCGPETNVVWSLSRLTDVNIVLKSRLCVCVCVCVCIKIVRKECRV